MNQQQQQQTCKIIAELEQAGAKVYRLGLADLAVGYHGENYFLKIRMSGGELKPADYEFLDTWPGGAGVVTSPAEALDFVGCNHA